MHGADESLRNNGHNSQRFDPMCELGLGADESLRNNGDLHFRSRTNPKTRGNL